MLNFVIKISIIDVDITYLWQDIVKAMVVKNVAIFAETHKSVRTLSDGPKIKYSPNTVHE